MKVSSFHEVSKVVNFLREKVVSNNIKINDALITLVGCNSAGIEYDDLPCWVSNHYLKDALGISVVPDGPCINLLIERYPLRSDHREALGRLYYSLDLEREPALEALLSADVDFANLSFSRAIRCVSDATISILKRSGEVSSTNKEYTEEQKKYFESNGYLIIPRILSEEKVDALARLTMLIAEQENSEGVAYRYGVGNKLQRIYNLISKHPHFIELLELPVVTEILEHYFRASHLHHKYVLSSFLANIIYPGGERDKLHVDSAVRDPLPPWPVRLNVNFALTDFTEDNGATLCVPGSHKLLSIPDPDNVNESLLKKLVAPKGSLIVWTGHIWHQSGANNTEAPRFSLNAGFAASYLKDQSTEEEHLVIVDEGVKNKLSPLFRLSIGLDRGIKSGAMYRANFSGSEFEIND